VDPARGNLTSVSRSSLGSALWWCCLGVLLLNDHVLKGGGVVPGWLTGKLSDFAGLVVAPVLACALLGCRSRGRRLLGFAQVVTPFVGIKLSGDFARAVEGVTRSLGSSWRLWVDATDLMALVVLPVAWRLTEPTPDHGRSVASSARERVGVFLGAVACLATSYEHGQVETRLFLLNVGHTAPEIQIFRSPVPFACAADSMAGVAAADFELERCAAATPFEVLPLDHDYRLLTDREVDVDRSPPPSSPRPCDAVVLRAAGLPPTVVYWRDGSEKVTVGDHLQLDWARSAGPVVFLEAMGERWILTPSEDSVSWPYQGALPEARCH